MAATTGSSRVTGYTIQLGDWWYEMPVDSSDGIDWAAELTAARLPQGGPEAVQLAEHLVGLWQNVQSMDVPELNATVFVPYPESGAAAALLLSGTAPVKVGETLDDLVESLKSDVGDETADGGEVLTVETWRGTFEAGDFVAGRRLVSIPELGEPQGLLEQSVVYYVVPEGADQLVQLYFIAENVIAFLDMPAETQQLAATLRIETESVDV